MDKFQPQNILKNSHFTISGVAGFIGSNIAETLLALGAHVTGLDNFSTGKWENILAFESNPAFEIIEGDIQDIDMCLRACKGADFVLHQAALGSVPRSVKDPATSTQVNIDGTLNMMIAAKDCAVKRFVYASSSSVYGDDVRLPKREGNEGNLLSPYAITKATNEKYAKLFHSLYGLETIGLRYFNVFGRYQDPESEYAAVIPKFIGLILKDERPRINGDGMQSRDFTHIENVVHANIGACLAPSNACGQAYNIASGGRVTIIELYNKLCELLDKRIEPFYDRERVGDIKHSNADISAAREKLSYNPKVTFEEGLFRTVMWFRDNMSYM